MCLTSSSDLHAGHHLSRRGLDAAGEELPREIEARYDDPRDPAALGVRRAAGEDAVAQAPLYANGLSGDQRAVVSDDAGGRDGRPQRDHRPGRQDRGARLRVNLWRREGETVQTGNFDDALHRE